MRLLRGRVPVLALLVGSLALPAWALSVPITVKETAGVGATGHPITVVVPLPYGQYQDTSKFSVGVPAQFEVLDRWWMRDSSIRNVMVHFQPTVSASGTQTYNFTDSGSGDATGRSLSVTETGSAFTVITGPLKFTVSKNQFNILDEVWFDRNGNRVYEASEKVVGSHTQNGGVLVGRPAGDVQVDASMGTPTFELEENGPMRVVIRAEIPAIYNTRDDHKHGFAVRIYAYDGQPLIKVDYQLQNSAKNVKFANPLYLEELRLDYRLELGTNPTVRFGLGGGSVYSRSRGSGLYIAQEFHDDFKVRDLQSNSQLASGTEADGFVDIRDGQQGVFAAIRNFWQTWPNGLEVDGSDKLSIQLFPDWSSQWYDSNDDAQAEFSTTGWYWLEDMQHVYKETLLYFHDGSVPDSQLVNLAKTFQYHPVGVLPVSWYQQTEATLDLDGVLPIGSRIGGGGLRPTYPLDAYDATNKFDYNFGWDNWYIDINRKWGVSQGGGWPMSQEYFVASQAPSDYFLAEARAIGELNIRPQWMAQYDHDRDWGFLGLTQAPYAGGRWRAQGDTASYLSGTGKDAKARDDQHGWFYHVEEAYYFTANPWIKDWYEFIKEFRKPRLDQVEAFPDRSSRGMAHSLFHALAAYRATGDTSVITKMTSYFRNYLYGNQDGRCGQRLDHKNRDTVFMAGYLMRTMIDYLAELRDGDWQAYAEAFNFVSGVIEWNYNTARFGGTLLPCAMGTSDDVSHTMVDPQSWYYGNTGHIRYLDQTDQYIQSGVPPGSQQPVRSIDWNPWEGQYHARYYRYVKDIPRGDNMAPPKVTDLSASVSGGNIVLTWTAPNVPDAARYHIVWSDKPISEVTTADPAMTNWWFAEAVGPDLAPDPGQQQSVTIFAGGVSPFYAALYSFDSTGNMSPMSNVAQSGGAPPVQPDPPDNLRVKTD